ncbi:MAG: AAA family ATPase [Pseudomonadales bacterium]|nr:AAA family ATPase [Pseudomonadales bacterium]
MMANNSLKLHFLGDLEVIRGQRVQILPPSKKTRGLLAYLVLHKKPFRREHLCDLLWEIPDDPRGSLRWSLSKLRRLVDDAEHTRIIADRASVSFDASDVEIDITTLHSLVSNDLKKKDTKILEDCANRYRGEFLEGLELPNFSDFYTWCIAERERAARSQTILLQELISRLKNQPERALDYHRQLVGLLPYDEAARAAYIRTLILLDRKQEAEQQYQVGIRLLKEISVTDSGLLYKAWREPVKPTTSIKREPSKIVDSGGVQSESLVGRGPELSQLRTLLETAISGQALFVLLCGEPGIGKTRILEFLAELAQEAGACLLRAGAFESKIIGPFALWSDAFRRSQLTSAAELLNGDKRISRDQLFRDMSHLVARETRVHPMVVLFDDIHWCDESSAAAIHYVMRTNREQALLVVATAREMELLKNEAVQQAIRGMRHDQLLQELKLGPLSQEALCKLITTQAPEADSQRLSQECRGNPLLAIELARAEVEGDQGSSLDELIEERISRFDEEVKDVLLWLAVLSPNIDLKLLGRATGLNGSQLNWALELAEKHHILQFTQQQFGFFHDLIAKSIYQTISPTRRQNMHRRVAELLELETALDLKLAADLAYHAEKSGDPGLAARAMVSAGRLCLRFYANEDALNLAHKGFQFTTQLGDAERVCLTLELCEIELAAAPLNDWKKAAENYISLAEEALDHGALPYARLGYQMASYVRWIHGNWSGAQRASLQAERVTRGGSDEEHIVGMAETALCLTLLEKDLSQAEAMLMEARSLASRKLISTSAISAAQGILRYFDNSLDKAEELLEEARVRCKSAGDRLNEYLANEYLIMVDIERENFNAAADRCQQLIAIGEKLREGSEAPFARSLTALCYYALNGESEALNSSLEALRLADAKQRLTYILNRAALLDIQFDDADSAIVHASEALGYAKLLTRNSDILLSHVALAHAGKLLNDRVSRQQHLTAIRAMEQTPVATWARSRANQLLAELK